jgi:hypothetical protein
MNVCIIHSAWILYFASLIYLLDSEKNRDGRANMVCFFCEMHFLASFHKNAGIQVFCNKTPAEKWTARSSCNLWRKRRKRLFRKRKLL